MFSGQGLPGSYFLCGLIVTTTLLAICRHLQRLRNSDSNNIGALNVTSDCRSGVSKYEPGLFEIHYKDRIYTVTSVLQVRPIAIVLDCQKDGQRRIVKVVSLGWPIEQIAEV